MQRELFLINRIAAYSIIERRLVQPNLCVLAQLYANGDLRNEITKINYQK